LKKERGEEKEVFRAPILCFVGLVGTGKTTIASSIAESLGRKFFRIPFGGMGDPLDLRGQSRMHPESEPGKIIKALKSVGSKNPIILLAPKLPLENEPDALVCIEALVKEVGRLDEDTIVLGHSLGGVLALRYLEAAEAISTPRAVILVGAPWQTKSEKTKGLFLTEFDYDVVMWKAKEFVVIHDKEDKLVPFDHAEKYQRMLNAELVATTGQDHFMEAQYPILLETVLKKTEPMPVIDPGAHIPDFYQS